MIRDIHIKAVLGGFIVNVGCQTVVFQRSNEMLQHLMDYLRDPEQVEAKFLGGAENARHFQVGAIGGAIGGQEDPAGTFIPMDRGARVRDDSPNKAHYDSVRVANGPNTNTRR